jgi:uncharacterized YccA/Bax inhibitor family protein
MKFFLGKKMGARIERFYPLILGLLFGVISFVLCKNYGVPEGIKDIFSAVMNICGVTIGFLATVKTIILAFNDQYIIKKLKERGSHKKILNYFLSAIKWSFFLLVFSAVGLGINLKSYLILSPYFIGIWSFVLVTTGASYYRAIDIFSAILRALD